MEPTPAECMAVAKLLNIPALIAELQECRPGQLRARAFDGDRITNGQAPADPTATAALGGNTPNLAAVYKHLVALADIQDRVLPNLHRGRADQSAPEGICVLHLRGADVRRPKFRNTDLSALLPEPLPICHPCIDFARSHGRLPTNEELRRHAHTGNWKVWPAKHRAA